MWSRTQRSGQGGLAWDLPNLAGAQALELGSADVEHEGRLALVHAATRAGGENRSPALNWSAVPAGTAQLLLVVEDPDAITAQPFVHCVALIDPALTDLEQGALDAEKPAKGVRPLRAGVGSGYFGPAPPKSHGPHRYVFQLFALATPVTLAKGGLDDAKPRDVLAAAGDVLARGRFDCFFERG
jgi:Raf kinase inhibitor-like YbhB/YbcL family protein